MVVRVVGREDGCEEDATLASALVVEGVKGSFVISGKEEVPETWFGVRNSTDLIKTT